jgi:hypothetical protein
MKLFDWYVLINHFIFYTLLIAPKRILLGDVLKDDALGGVSKALFRHW